MSASGSSRPQCPLLAWHRLDENPNQTARELFDALAKDDFVPVEELASAWLSPKKVKASSIKESLVLFARAAGSAERLSYEDFLYVLRLWHATDGDLPSLRRYLLQSVAEACTSAVLAMGAMQASSTALGPSATIIPQLTAVGGVGLLVTTTLFDANCVKPSFRQSRSDKQPATGGFRRLLFAGASISGGILLAPAVPLLASTIGDPKTKGYGPLAVAGLAIAHASAHAALLSSLPDKALPQITADGSSSSASIGRSVLVSSGAGLATAAVGVGVIHLSKREGALTPVLAATCLLSLHAAGITSAAASAYSKGLPEPLRPAMSPMEWLVSIGAKVMQLSS